MKHPNKETLLWPADKEKQITLGLLAVQTFLIVVLFIQFNAFGSEVRELSGFTENLSDKLDTISAALKAPAVPSQAGAQPSAPTFVEASADDDPFKGDPNAPVTIIEFSDFQCPFCGRFYSQTLSQIEKEYIETGKVKFVYRDFPILSIHPYAQKAAEAAECADEQGKFWEYHNIIFENQGALSETTLKKWASDLGLDAKEFNSCLASGKMAAEVNKDLADGSAAGVTGTPGFFINGIAVSGAQPFSVFKQVIDAALAEAEK